MLRLRRKKEKDIAELLASPDSTIDDLKKVFATHDIILKAFTVASTAAGLLFTVLQMAGLLTDIRYVAFIPVMWFVVFILTVQPTEEEKRKSAVISKLAITSLVPQLAMRGPAIADFIRSLATALADGKITPSEAGMLLDKIRAIAEGQAPPEVQQAFQAALERAGLTPEQLAAISTGAAAPVAVGVGKRKVEKATKAETKEKGPVKVM